MAPPDETSDTADPTANSGIAEASPWPTVVLRRARSGTVRSIIALAGGNVASAALGGLGGLLAAKFVDPEVAGRFRFYTIPLMYLTFLHVGTFDALTRQIPLNAGRGRQDIVRTLASTAGAWNVLVSAAVSSGFLALAAWNALHGHGSAALGWASQAIACWAVFYGGYLAATYRTIAQFVGLARVQAAQALLSFALVFLLPSLSFAGLCLRGAAPAALSAWLFHVGRPLKVRLRLERRTLVELVSVGMPFCFWGSIYTSLWFALENTLMLHLGGVQGLGLLTVAVVLREGVSILPKAINQVLIPQTVESFGRTRALATAHVRLLRLVVPLVLFMGVTAFVLGLALDVIVPWFIPKYVGGLGLMKLSLWFGVQQALELPLGSLFASGRPLVFGRGIAAGFVAFLAATICLVPYLGGGMAVLGGSLTGRLVRCGVGYWDIFLLTRRETADVAKGDER